MHRCGERLPDGHGGAPHEPDRQRQGDVFFVPADVEGLEGLHGVMWTVQTAAGEVVYETGCSAVTLD